jgi:hypothetical protein
MEIGNRTMGDAYARVMLARVGCFVDASDAYLDALRVDVLRWAEQIGAEISRRAAEAARREDDAADAEGCEHESALTPDGNGAYCRHCGLTLA